MTTATPWALSRSASVLPMNPAPPVMSAFLTPEMEAGGQRVGAEHLHGLEREGVEILAEQVELRDEVARHRDDVAADRVGLDEVEDLPGAGPDELGGGGDRLENLERPAHDGQRLDPGIRDAPREHGDTARRTVPEGARDHLHLVRRHQ